MNKTTIKIAAIVFSILVIAGLLIFSVSQREAYQKLNKQWHQEQHKMVVLQKEIDDIKQSIERYKEEQAEFEKSLFQERDVPAFLDEISKYAKANSINIVDIKTQQFSRVAVPEEFNDVRGRNKNLDQQLSEEEKKLEAERIMTLAAMPIQVKVKGSFESFVKFINNLQEYKQLLNITNVEIQTSSQYPSLDCQFVIRIYSLKTLKELQLK